MTVLTAITLPLGASAGSLQVLAVLPSVAAALLLMSTVPLPILMVALFEGGFWNGPPGGTCCGVLLATLPTVAAGWF